MTIVLLVLVLVTFFTCVYLFRKLLFANKYKDYVYLDNNGTTRIFDESLRLMDHIYRHYYGNAGGMYELGTKSKKLLELSRERLAKLVHCDACELYFTSGATESNNIAIRGVYAKHKHIGKHIITTGIEHPSGIEPCKALEGAEVTVLGVDRYGKINLQELHDAIRNDTVLVSVIVGNNEIGTIQDIAAIARICRAKGVHLHADMTQMFGKYRIHLHELGVDSATGSGHKFHSPKSTGFLFLKTGAYFDPSACVSGGHQEKNIRSGTENVPGIVSMTYSLYICNVLLEEGHATKIEKMRNWLRDTLTYNIPGIIINGHPTDCMYNTLSVCLPVNSRKVVAMLDKANIAVNTGSACSKGGTSSRVLDAIGLTPDQQQGSLRISFGFLNTWDDCETAARFIVQYTRLLLYKDSSARQDACPW